MSKANPVNYVWVVISVVTVMVFSNKYLFPSADRMGSSTNTTLTDISKIPDSGNVRSTLKSQSEISAEIQTRFTLSDYQYQLEQKKYQLESGIKKSDLVERILLNRELELIGIKIDNSAVNYREKIDLLVELYLFLDKIEDIALLEENETAKNYLLNGGTSRTFNLLAKLTLNKKAVDVAAAVNHIANAAYLRGKIAQEKIDYERAYRLYRQAVMTTPDNISYLITAGDIANNIALYGNAIDYFETALHAQKKQKLYRDKHSRDIWFKLGTTWSSKGDADKALKYFELALQSDLKTFGNHHINVAVDKNGLGVAWEAKGKIKKAIQNYQQALKISQQQLGMEHQSSLSIAENLQAATALSTTSSTTLLKGDKGQR